MSSLFLGSPSLISNYNVPDCLCYSEGELVHPVQVQFDLQSCEDVFLFDDDVILVVDFDVGGRIALGDDFIAFFDGFDIRTDSSDDGVGWGFLSLTEQDARFGRFHGLFFDSYHAVL